MGVLLRRSNHWLSITADTGAGRVRVRRRREHRGARCTWSLPFAVADAHASGCRRPSSTPFAGRHMNGLEDAAVLSRIDHTPSSALRVQSRIGAGSVKPPLSLGVPAQGVPSAIVETLLQTVGADGLPDMKMTRAAKASADQQSLLLESFDRAQRVASGRAEAADSAWLSKGFSAFRRRRRSVPGEMPRLAA